MLFGFLAENGLADWHVMSDECKLLSLLPSNIGVFVITKVGNEGQEIEFIHCGIGVNQKGLKNRIRQIYHPGPTQSTNQNIKNRLDSGQALQLSYKVCESNYAAKELKAKIMKYIGKSEC